MMNYHEAVTPELQLSVEQFYHQEARLLDNRQYQTWFALVDPAKAETAVEHIVKHRSDLHYPKPRAVSITQATELGTVYSVSDTM